MILALQVSSIQNLWSLAIIMAIAVIIPMILSIPKLKVIPSLVLEIIVGLIIGLAFYNTGFLNNFFTDESSNNLQPAIEVLYMVGLSFVLFLSGLDTDFSVFKKKPKGEKHFHVGLFSILCLILVIAASFGASYLFTAYITDTKTLYAQLLLTIAFSSTFASLVIPVIKDKGLEESTLGKIIGTYSTLSELISVVGLSVIMLLYNLENDETINFIGIGLFVVLMLSMVIIKLAVPLEKIFGKKLKGVTHLETRVIILIFIIAVLLADLSGVEYILGAFLVGMLLKTISKEKDFEGFEKFGFGFFVPMFYILLGIKLGIATRSLGDTLISIDNVLLALKVLGILVAVKVPLLLLFIYYPKRSTIPSLFLTTSTIIVAIAIEHLSHEHLIFSDNLTIILILDSLLTCIIPPIIFGAFRGSAVPRKKFLNIMESPEYREEDFMKKSKNVVEVEVAPKEDNVEMSGDEIDNMISVPNVDNNLQDTANIEYAEDNQTEVVDDNQVEEQDDDLPDEI